MKKEEKLKKIIEHVNKHNISAYKIANGTKISEAGIGKILNKLSKNPQERTVDAIYKFLFNEEKQYHQPEINYQVNEDGSKFKKNKDYVNHYEKLLNMVNGRIKELEEHAGDIDGYKELSELIKLKADIQKELDSV